MSLFIYLWFTKWIFYDIIQSYTVMRGEFMKKILSIIILLALIMSFSGCNNINFEEEKDTQSEEDKIKSAVLDLMKTSESQEDPANLFAYYTGDFQITNFTSSSDGIKSIKRKEAVTHVDLGSRSYYCIEAAGNMFYASDRNQSAEMIVSLPLSADVPDSSTIFTVFGMDTSSLYPGDVIADEPDILTADMLSVSEDKATCNFSKSYINTIAKALCKSMGFTNSVTTSFIEKYTGSGVYSVEENKVTFDIKIKDKKIGSIHQITEYAIDDEGKVYAYSYLEYSNSSAGITSPIVAEVEYKDVVYRDSDPISATITMKNSSKSSVVDGGVTIKFVDNIETTFKLDCTDLDSRSATATRKKKRTETALGQSSTYNYTDSLVLDLGKSSSQFQYTEKDDAGTNTSIKANKVKFATSSAIVTPKHVTDEITSYIDKNFP